MLACAKGELAQLNDEAVAFDPQTALTVVMAAKGYPDTPEKGGTIELSESISSGVKVFHAGTSISDGRLVASGGRVLNVTALDKSVTSAQSSAYSAAKKIHFPSGFYRTDIGYREVARERA